MTRGIWRTAVLVLTLTLGACTNFAPPASPQVTTDTFQGSLMASGRATHVFTVTQDGPVGITLLGLLPDANLVVGLGIGTWNGDTCSLLSLLNDATQGSVINGSAKTGAFCATVFDVGNVVDDISYTLTVIHP